MEQTQRARPPRPPRPPPEARPEPPLLPAAEDPHERLALLIAVLGASAAPALLDGLGRELRGRIAPHVERLGALGSASRRARLARSFAPSSAAPVCVRGLLGEVGPELTEVILGRLPPFLTPPGPRLPPRGEPPPSALAAFGRRLAREAAD